MNIIKKVIIAIVKNKNEKNSMYFYPKISNHKLFTVLMLSINSKIRFILFSILCCLINIAGLIVSQSTPYSMFYLDTIGTALAGLLGGVNAAILVGLLSNVVGGYIIDASDFALFGICNMVAGISWAILPRMGSKIFGENIFAAHESNGYSMFIKSILTIGFTVGLITTIASFSVQAILFDLTISPEKLTMKGSIAKSVVSINNIYLVGVFLQGFEGFIDIKNAQLFVFISSLISNIPDKILSTSVAFMIIVGAFRMPNFSDHKLAISKEHINVSTKWNRPVFGLIILTFYYIYLINIRYENFNFNKIIFILAVFIFAASVLYLSRKYVSRSVDPYKRHKEYVLFFARKDTRNYPSFRKDAFEDSIKLLTISFAISQFAVSYSITDGAKPIILNKIANLTNFTFDINGESIKVEYLDMGILLVFNVLLLQSLRYFIAIFLRILGRF